MGLFAKLFPCCNSSRLGKSVHFHPPAEDSVHVMIKHDARRHKEKGEALKGYSPRKPLSEILAAQRAQQNQGQATIQATEDDDQILANLKNADNTNQSTAQ